MLSCEAAGHAACEADARETGQGDADRGRAVRAEVGPVSVVAAIHRPLRGAFGATDRGRECAHASDLQLLRHRHLMYYDDHNPPHFHATYGEHDAAIELATCQVLRGSLPPRALRLVKEWTFAHTAELIEDWDRARNGQTLEPIAPLS